MALVANREVGNGATLKRDRAVALERRGSIPDQVEQRLNDLVAIEVNEWQARIIVPVEGNLLLVFRLDNSDDVLNQFVNVHRPLIGWTTRAEQCIDEPGQPVGLADYNIGVLGQLTALELPGEQLCSTTNSAERVLYFVRELTNHLSTCAVLNQQCVFAADFVAPRNIRHLNEQCRVAAAER